MPLLHIVAAELRDDAPPEAVQQALAYARGLAAAHGVRAARCGRSDTQLLAAVWLDDAAALEPFAASQEHMSFVMRGLAPAITGMWSASVATQGPPPAQETSGRSDSLWLFAVPQFEGVFEWEVRRLLDDVATLPGSVWAGPTIEERERYRAGGAVLLSHAEVRSFQESLAAARAGWGNLADHLQQTDTVALSSDENAR
ncbi:MAG: hypothetical protein HOH95_08140 [Dehalococcoidia bacterium]|nr:hypothetical protein [Dehalococcoidia bacterium]